jgi:aldose 1-epimerase
VSTVGASLQSLVVDGLSLICGDPRGPVGFSGAVLVPWPNRVRGGRWRLGRQLERLDRTEPDAGNALHGLVATMTFSVIASDDSSVAMAVAVDRAPGYPFELDVVVSYRLVPLGVRSTITIANRSDRAAPVAVGVHPYVHLGDSPADTLRVQIGAGRTMLLGSDNLPAGIHPTVGTRFDVRLPTPLEAAPSHAAYTDLDVSEGRVVLRLDDGDRGRAVQVWADERFGWAQLYVTDAAPAVVPGTVAVALEPMTAPPDALNSGTDLRWMEPCSRWVLNWGVAREADKNRGG